MNAQMTPKAESAGDSQAWASVTIWSDGVYFLQVHYGYFDSWEAAEDFADVGSLRLESRSNALFLTGPHGAAWIPDQAMQIFRTFNNSARSTYEMTLDDLLEEVQVEDMELQGIGSQPVQRGRPIIAQALGTYDIEAANDQ
jgi:hypothetical protein